MVDIGMYWSAPVLRHKLERRGEEVWNCRRLPKGLGRGPQRDRLFIASEGRWVGFFRLVPEILYTPEDSSCPYALIFDVGSWTRIPKTFSCKPFRGWTYNIPESVSNHLPP